MLIIASTETDLQAKQVAESFRVTFYESPSSPQTQTFYIRQSTLPEVMHWADETALHRTYSIQLVSLDKAGIPSLTQLIGVDIRSPGTDTDPLVRGLRHAMVSRQKTRRREALRELRPSALGLRFDDDFLFLDDSGVSADEQWPRCLQLFQCGISPDLRPDQIALARTFITIVYRNQTNRYLEPEVTHRLAVASNIIDRTSKADPVLLSAALLDGITSETAVTQEDLRSRGVSADVFKVLAALDELRAMPTEEARALDSKAAALGGINLDLSSTVTAYAETPIVRRLGAHIIRLANQQVEGREARAYYESGRT